MSMFRRFILSPSTFNICVSCYSKTVFEYSRTRREPVYSKTVLPFLNSDAHIWGIILSQKENKEINIFWDNNIHDYSDYRIDFYEQCKSLNMVQTF
jgi:hypothetical protein